MTKNLFNNNKSKNMVLINEPKKKVHMINKYHIIYKFMIKIKVPKKMTKNLFNNNKQYHHFNINIIC